jgi:molybdate transport system substrate-binding protein
MGSQRTGSTARGRGRQAWLLCALIVLAAAGSVSPSCRASGSADNIDASSPGPVELVVSAAADLSPVLAEIKPLFESESGLILKTNIGSTGQLRQQIESGARVDVFLAASTSAIDQLAEKDLLVAGTAKIYARGRLAIWSREGSPVSPRTVQDLTLPDIRRISIANPDHAPYGQAAREALESSGLWNELQPKLVPGENILQAFQYAETGNVDVGLVALSLVANIPGTYELVPEALHNPINQALAIIASSPHQDEATRFVAFLTGDRGSEILRKYGFVLPEVE